jgi:phosphoribosylanthranilate isomerase
LLTRLKICGITRIEDAIMCEEVGVDVLGFNFYPNSIRYIPPKSAGEIIKNISFHVRTVGLLVQPLLEEVKKIIQESKVSALQIYDPQDFEITHSFDVPIISTCSADKIKDFSAINNTSMILIDTSSKDKYGGTGKTFDWDLIPSTIPKSKLILAGGINTDNITEALKRVDPAIIDVASGSESSPGKKDKSKVSQLVEKVMEHNLNKYLNKD